MPVKTMKAICDELMAELPDSFERSQALLKMQEAIWWAAKAYLENGDLKTDD